MVVVLVLKQFTVNPVRFAPEKVSAEADVVLSASAPLLAVTRIDTSFCVAVTADVFTVNPVTATPVVEFATGVMVTMPLAMFDAVIKPVTAAPELVTVSPLTESAAVLAVIFSEPFSCLIYAGPYVPGVVDSAMVRSELPSTSRTSNTLMVRDASVVPAFWKVMLIL